MQKNIAGLVEFFENQMMQGRADHVEAAVAAVAVAAVAVAAGDSL